MPLMDETAPKDILDGILKVQAQQMKLAGMLQGSGIAAQLRQRQRRQRRGHRRATGAAAQSLALALLDSRSLLSALSANGT
jgi:hypothetical protein